MEENLTRKSVFIRDVDWFYFDDISREIKRECKESISVSAMIRAMMAAIKESGIDLTDCQSEDDVVDTISSRLNNYLVRPLTVTDADGKPVSQPKGEIRWGDVSQYTDIIEEIRSKTVTN